MINDKILLKQKRRKNIIITRMKSARGQNYNKWGSWERPWMMYSCLQWSINCVFVWQGSNCSSWLHIATVAIIMQIIITIQSCTGRLYVIRKPSIITCLKLEHWSADASVVQNSSEMCLLECKVHGLLGQYWTRVPIKVHWAFQSTTCTASMTGLRLCTAHSCLVWVFSQRLTQHEIPLHT